MDHRISYAIVIFAAFLLGLIVPGSVSSQTLRKELGKAGGKPIRIESKTLELNEKSKVVTFAGDVKSNIDNFVIKCNKMLVYYESEKQPKKEAGKVEASINRIVAMGNVRIIRGQGGTAFAQQAVYYQKGEKVVLTGNPVVKKGDDSVAGDRITIFLKENRSIVESTQGKKVKALIHPDREKKK
jgi:lipopolysaccharide export system protein LptA